MRKVIIHIKIIGIFLMVCLGCTKKLERLYNDPDELTNASLEKLFTEMLNNYRVRPSYWEFRTFVLMHTGIYSQTTGFLNTTGIYQQNPSYIESKWNDFYRPMGSGTGTLALYREMQKVVAKLAPEEQEKATMFLKAATVFVYDLACQMVDCWGDIPFSEAGSLNAEGQAKMARFDEGAEIYQEAIRQLKELNDYFDSVQPDQATASLFARQDILLSGDLNKWQRYSNSLRLRLLMRISEVEENFVKTEAGEMLANAARYPLLSSNPDYHPGEEDILLEPLSDYTFTLREALTELSNLSAPYFMLEKLMLPAEDPRIPVMFDKYGVLAGGSF